MKKKALAFILVLQILLLAALPVGAQTAKGSFNPVTLEYQNYTLYFDNNRARWDNVQAQYSFWDFETATGEVKTVELSKLENGLYYFSVTGKGELKIKFSTLDQSKTSEEFLTSDEAEAGCNLYTIEPTFYTDAWGEWTDYLGTWIKQPEYAPGMKYTNYFNRLYERHSRALDFYAEGEIKPESLEQVQQVLTDAKPVYSNPNEYTQEEIDRQTHILYDTRIESYEYFLYGDIDLNGDIEVGDILLLQKYLAHMDSLTEFQLEVAQVRGKHETTMQDVLCIQNYLAGKISSFPVNYYPYDPITIYFDNSSYQWEKVCCYFFPEDNPWPGRQMELVKGDLYKLTLYDYPRAYIAFDNKDGVQYPAQNEKGFYVIAGDTVLFRDGKLIYNYVPEA